MQLDVRTVERIRIECPPAMRHMSADVPGYVYVDPETFHLVENDRSPP